MAQATPPPTQPAPDADNAPQRLAPMDWAIIIGIILIIFNTIYTLIPFAKSWIIQLAVNAIPVAFGLVQCVIQVQGKQSSLLLYGLLYPVRKAQAIKQRREDLAISCVYTDKAWAQWIEFVLDRNGYHVVRAEWDGGDFHQYTNQLKAKIPWKMFIQSQVYKDKLGEDDSKWKEQTDHHKSLLVNVHPDQSYDKPQVINLVGLDELEAEEKLLQEVRLRLGRPKHVSNNPGVSSKKPLYPRAVWHVPTLYGVSSHFKGQKKILDSLYRGFIGASNQSLLTQPHALTGLAQIGKMQIALKFAAEHRSDYNHVFLIETDSRQHMIEGFRDMAVWIKPQDVYGNAIVENGTIVAGITDDQQIEAVKRWLIDHERVLVIFHIHNNPQWQEIARFLPRRSKSHILLTTCNAFPAFGGAIAPPIRVGNLEPEEGACVLLLHAGKTEDDPDWQTAMVDAIKIVEKIGGFPLMLALIGQEDIGPAGTIIENYAKTVNKETMKRILQTPNQLTPKTIAECWEEQFKRVEGANPVAAKLLRFCAFCGREKIPEAILEQEVQQLNAENSSETTLDNATQALSLYSFVDRRAVTLNLNGQRVQSTEFAINPLLQVWVRECFITDEQERIRMAERVIKAVARVLSHSDDRAIATYIEHAKMCANNIVRSRNTSAEAKIILSWLLENQSDEDWLRDFHKDVRECEEVARLLVETVAEVFNNTHPNDLDPAFVIYLAYAEEYLNNIETFGIITDEAATLIKRLLEVEEMHRMRIEKITLWKPILDNILEKLKGTPSR